jgi:hypothetical protein
MDRANAESEILWRRLQELLLRHLWAAHIPVWPGADGITLEAVLRSYPQAVADGCVPSPAQLLAEHPDLEQQLAIFFTGPNRL